MPSHIAWQISRYPPYSGIFISLLLLHVCPQMESDAAEKLPEYFPQELLQKETLRYLENIEEASFNYLNPFTADSRYVGKKVCRSEMTWTDVAYPWSVLSKKLEPNCSLLHGNLVLAGITNDDDLSVLHQLEEVSGYVIIHGVSRTELVVPELRIIHGLQFVTVRTQHIALLVSNNYIRNHTPAVQKRNRSLPLNGTMETGCVGDCSQQLESAPSSYAFMRILSMPQLIAILHNGVYFFDNPGLCYGPYTIKWDDLLETAELQSVHLYALQPDNDVHMWYAACQCQYLRFCPFSSIPLGTQTSHTATEKLQDINLSAAVDDILEIEQSTVYPHDPTAMGSELPLPFSPPDFVQLDNMSREKRDTVTSRNFPHDIPRGKHERNAYTSLNMDPDLTNSIMQLKLPPLSSADLDADLKEEVRPHESKVAELSTTEILYAADSSPSASIIPWSWTSPSRFPSNEGTDNAEIRHSTETNTGVTTATEEHILISERSSYYAMPNGASSESTGSQTTQLKFHDSAPFAETELQMLRLLTTETYSTHRTDSIQHTTSEQVPEPEQRDIPFLPCHSTCPLIQGKRYCWGPKADQCQKVYKCQTKLCDGSNWCFRAPQKSAIGQPPEEQCCHSECAAGCNGPRAADCRACLRYSNNGVCLSSCPSPVYYDKTTFSWKTNPHGLVAFGWKCVKSCPAPFLQEWNICVPKCSQPGTYARDGHCVSCPDGVCPKVCTMKMIETNPGIDYLHKSSLRAMRNCTVFEGNLKLSRQSFVGDPFYNLTAAEEAVQWSDLVAGLSMLRELSGVLYIGAGSNAPWLTNLTFLSNLQIIRGVSPNIQQTRAVNINSNQHLEFLGLASLQRIGHPSILITGNPNLCYLDTIDWSRLMSRTDSQSTGPMTTSSIGKPDTEETLDSKQAMFRAWLQRQRSNINKRRSLKMPAVYISDNGHPQFCRGKNARCAEECTEEDGCWGPGPWLCGSCRSWMISQRNGSRLCVRSCDTISGYFTPIGQEDGSSMDERIPAENSNTFLSSLNEGQTRPGSNFDESVTSSRECGKCSPMCRPIPHACHGPGSNHCNGPCRWVQDGPYCRKTCPPEKYLDPVSGLCLDCASTCTAPLTVSTIGQSSNEGLGIISVRNAEQEWCTGPGTWPGHGGCSFCRQALAHVDSSPAQGTQRIECVQDCPSGMFAHVINLLYRGGSSHFQHWKSFHRLTGQATFPAWTASDAALFNQLPSAIQLDLVDWLVNHTQPLVYGLARICLPCHKECARLPPATDVTCTGPGPHQCTRCAHAVHQGRCTTQCPEGTYASASMDINAKDDYSLTSETELETAALGQPHGHLYCHPCHVQCQSGCTGPSNSECHRCRHVKIYLNSRKTQWNCTAVCPSVYNHRIFDHQTGDVICSTVGKRLSPALKTMNLTLGVNATSQSLWDLLESINLFDRSFLASPNGASTLTALIVLTVFLIGLGGLIYWAAIRQIPKEHRWSLVDKVHSEHRSIVTRLNDACERLWTRGRPQRLSPPRKHPPRRKPMHRKTFQPLLCAHTDQCFVCTDQDDQIGEQPGKPNMATLRIITESQLVRGPLIGSGAFGTVFCGIWRPQNGLSSETLSHTSVDQVGTKRMTLPVTWSDGTETAMNTSFLSYTKLDNAKGLFATKEVSKESGAESTQVEIPVAIKVLSDAGDPQTNKELLEEAKVMATVDHPCCLRFLALCLTARMQLITQFMPLGSLLDFVKSNVQIIQVHTFVAWAEQIASGMTYLASRGIIHRDLAARNVLVESLGQIRITDFGLAKCLDCIGSEYHASGGRMPIKWLAIECIQNRVFSSKSDVWSYGVTLWEMCTFGKRPFDGIRARDLLQCLERGMRLMQPETTSLEFYAVLLRCWEADPNKRPTFDELLTILQIIKRKPERYICITAGMRQRHQQSSQFTSSEALEFLSNTLSSNSQHTRSDEEVTEPNSTTDSTEYAQMQADWIKTLYVNSQMTTFPPCIHKFLSNNYIYLKDTQQIDRSQLANEKSYCQLTFSSGMPSHEADRSTPSVLPPRRCSNIRPVLTTFRRSVAPRMASFAEETKEKTTSGHQQSATYPNAVLPNTSNKLMTDWPPVYPRIQDTTTMEATCAVRTHDVFANHENKLWDGNSNTASSHKDIHQPTENQQLLSQTDQKQLWNGNQPLKRKWSPFVDSTTAQPEEYIEPMGTMRTTKSCRIEEAKPV
ncbi:unnamed protein product [Dicrocoelium dendriticum]|nr:unnamed protein product [Dicrocoelium dendriticum]